MSEIIRNIAFTDDGSGGLSFDGNVAFNGGISLGNPITEVITTDQDNFNIPGISSGVLVRLDFQFQRDITGIVPPDTSKSTWIIVLNVGNRNGRLRNNDSSSQAENRFLFSGNILLQPEESATLIYDTISQRWRAFAVYK